MSRIAVVLAVVTLGLLAAPLAAARAPAPAARASGLPPQITSTLRDVAEYFTRLRLREQYAEASDTFVFRLTKKVITKWAASKAKECPDPLPDLFFCERPAGPRWGVGTSLEIDGRWAGEYRSQWIVATPPRVLRPDYNWWLKCWSAGREVRDGGGRSNLWYRLSNDLWVNSLYLYTGTNVPIEGMSRC